VLWLTWRQVDFRAGTVRLEPGTTKNGEGRTFPFAALPELAELLGEQWERTQGFQRERGRIVYSTGQARRSGASARSGRRRADWRACRGCCSTPPAHGGAEPGARRRAGSAAMMPTGHKTEAVYRRYAIVSEADLAAAGAKLAALHDRLAATTVGLQSGRKATEGAS